MLLTLNQPFAVELKSWALRLTAFMLLAVGVYLALNYLSCLLLFEAYGVSLSEAGPLLVWDYLDVYGTHSRRLVRLSVQACAYLPVGLTLCALPLLFSLVKGRGRALHGDARFASRSEIIKAGLLRSGEQERTILVGRVKDEYLSYAGCQFVVLAAPTRSGKGVGIVIPNCLNYSDSLVVLDIKYENFEHSAGFRAAHGQRVYFFAPFDEKGRTHRYNPLEYISEDPASRLGDIDAIATALYSNPNSRDRFFDEQAKDLFRGICLMVLETPHLPHTLGEILRQSSGYGKSIQEHLSEMITKAEAAGHPYSSACVDAINRVITLSPNTFAGVKGSMQVPLLIFANPRVDAATSANDFDLRAVRKERMSIYLGILPDKLGEAAVLINLFFDQLLNLNCRKLPSQDPSLKYQCLLILDEFTAIGKVNMISKSIAYQAGFNMRVLTIIQNKSQLEEVYGRSGAVTLLSNHALMVMYAPSPTEPKEANEYSDLLGYQTVEGHSRSKSFGRNVSRSRSVSEQRRALMLPQELRELRQDQEIVTLEHTRPILCQKICYYQDPSFQDRCALPPPEIPVIDLDLFVSRLEDRRRDLREADLSLEDEEFISHLCGYSDIPSLDEIVSAFNDRQAAGELQYPDFARFMESRPSEAASEVVRNVLDHVMVKALDPAGFRLSDKEASALSETLLQEAPFATEEDELMLTDRTETSMTQTPTATGSDSQKAWEEGRAGSSDGAALSLLGQVLSPGITAGPEISAQSTAQRAANADDLLSRFLKAESLPAKPQAVGDQIPDSGPGTPERAAGEALSSDLVSDLAVPEPALSGTQGSAGAAVQNADLSPAATLQSSSEELCTEPEAEVQVTISEPLALPAVALGSGPDLAPHGGLRSEVVLRSSCPGEPQDLALGREETAAQSVAPVTGFGSQPVPDNGLSSGGQYSAANPLSCSAASGAAELSAAKQDREVAGYLVAPAPALSQPEFKPREVLATFGFGLKPAAKEAS